MNLFQKYGIKEVADVVFYSINKVGDTELYTPVLFLDTLKVSTLEKTAEKVEAKGGKGNKKLISWNFGKEIKLNLEDALFTPASMSMIWGGELQSKLSPYTSAIVKLNIANKYGNLHYSTKAYPSPALTDEEWEIVFSAAEKYSENEKTQIKYIYTDKEKDQAIIEENRVNLRKQYFWRNGEYPDQRAINKAYIDYIIKEIDNIKKIGHIKTKIYETEKIDRMERCIVTERNGLAISTSQQKENLIRYYQNDESSSYVIYYDAKTMMPLLSISEDGIIKGWDNDGVYDRDFDMKTDNDVFRIKIGTVYYKWSRTIKRKESPDDGILGRTFVIDADTFPEAYKIVGETYIRDAKTGKDQRYQFTIHRAQVSTDTNITLQADGDPTTFTMSIDVLTPPNDIMIELKQFDVDEDKVHGGTRIISQKSNYTHTPTTIEFVDKVDIDNPEIY